jgi:hypothetical protein
VSKNIAAVSAFFNAAILSTCTISAQFIRNSVYSCRRQ